MTLIHPFNASLNPLSPRHTSRRFRGICHTTLYICTRTCALIFPMPLNNTVLCRRAVQGPGPRGRAGLAGPSLHALRARGLPHRARATRPRPSRRKQRASREDDGDADAPDTPTRVAQGADQRQHGGDARPPRPLQPAPAAVQQADRVGL